MRGGTLLLETADGWQVLAAGRGSRPPVAVDVSAETGEESAEAIIGAIAAAGGRRGSAVIAPQTALFATFPTAELGDARSREARTFALERSLPLDAERIVADFVDVDETTTAVAIDADRYGPLVDALETRGVRTQAIVPAALLLVDARLRLADARRSLKDVPSPRAVVSLSDPFASDVDALDGRSDIEVDLFTFDGGRLLDWQRRPLGAAAASLRLDRPEAVVLLKPSDADRALNAALDAATQTDRPRVSLPIDDPQALIRRAAGDVLSGRVSPRFDLRRDALAAGDPLRRLAPSLAMVAAAATLLVLAAAAGSWRQAEGLRAATEELRAERQTAYESVFGTGEVPRTASRRLAARHRDAVRRASEESDAPSDPSAIEVLDAVLRTLPQDVRVRVDEVAIDGGAVSLAVAVNAHEDAGRVARLLDDGPFAFERPSTSRTAGGEIVARLEGIYRPPSEANDDQSTTAFRPESNE